MGFEFVQLDDYIKLPRAPQPWVIENLIPVGGLVNIFGKPKTKKSFIAFDMASKVASHEDHWEGFAIQSPGPVLYLQVDTPREEWARRAMEVKEKVNGDGVPLYIADMWLVPQFPLNIAQNDDPTLGWLKAEVERIQPVMVVIDTLREVHGGDENDSTIMRNVIGNLVGCCRPSAIVLVSHARKDQIGWGDAGGEADIMDSARGSSYVAGRMDVVINVTRKRLQYKGRAGQGTEQLVHDPDSGWVKLQQDNDDGSNGIIDEIVMTYPGISQTQLAERLAKRMQFSESTATRRVREWLKKNQLKSAKLITPDSKDPQNQSHQQQ